MVNVIESNDSEFYEEFGGIMTIPKNILEFRLIDTLGEAMDNLFRGLDISNINFNDYFILITLIIPEKYKYPIIFTYTDKDNEVHYGFSNGYDRSRINDPLLLNDYGDLTMLTKWESNKIDLKSKIEYVLNSSIKEAKKYANIK